ncbi:MAG: hypothetical protein SNH55_07620 [Rikenellaceae bacterium]
MYPIILFTYNRPDHTLKVLEALKRNTLASESHLYIFVDGPKEGANPETIQQIEAVREVVQRETWCGSVEYHISETNIGCRDSIIQGISYVLKNHEAIIVLEDDIVTSPHFLSYINKCLDYYKNYRGVFSISGVTIPQKRFTLPHDYPYDVYVSLRQLNSGWATWADRWNLIEWGLGFVDSLNQDIILSSSYSRGGDDLVSMLLEQIDGKIDAWDVQFTYNHFKHHAVSIIPRYSYVDNIGGDGSGTHHFDDNKTLRFDLEQAIPEPRLLDVIYEDSRIINAFYNAFCRKKRPLWQKAFNFIARKLSQKPPFVIKKKIYNG